VRHADAVRKLGRTKQHRRALLRNLVSQLFAYERIRTTLPKAKEARRYAERLIGFAKKQTLGARREAAMFISDKSLVKKLFDVIGPRFSDRAGGYTRVLKLGPRDGDGAEMAILELVIREERHKEKAAKAAAAKEKGGRKPKAAKTEKQSAEKPGGEAK
jgi:large subunit ribosomal protein L17